MIHEKIPVQGLVFAQPENQNQQHFGEIIPVISDVIGKHKTTVISTRALHKALRGRA